MHFYQPDFDPERCGMVVAGVDVIEIARIQRSIDDFGERFLRRVFTEHERERFGTRPSELAARFAAKRGDLKGARNRNPGNPLARNGNLLIVVESRCWSCTGVRQSERRSLVSSLSTCHSHTRARTPWRLSSD